MTTPLAVEDREFLLNATRAACCRAKYRTLAKALDQALLGELSTIRRLGSPTQRDFALKVLSLPLPGDFSQAMDAAAMLIEQEVDCLGDVRIRDAGGPPKPRR